MKEIKSSNLYFIDIGEEWLNYKIISIKHSTFIKYENLLRIHIFPYFKNKLISEIDDTSISLFLNSKTEKLANSTLKTLYYLIHAILQYGEKKYGINIKHYKISIPKTQSKVRALNNTEFSNIEKCAKATKSRVGIAIIISLYTGMRIGEICALKWEDIDFNNKVIYVSKTIQRIKINNHIPLYTLTITSPKSMSSRREIPIINVLYEYLMSKHNNADNHTFVLNNLEKPVDPRQIQAQFRKILHNLDLEDITFHTLRHTFATNCVQEGIDIKSLSEILGHSSVSITLNLYVHTSREFKQKELEKLNNFALENT